MGFCFHKKRNSSFAFDSESGNNGSLSFSAAERRITNWELRVSKEFSEKTGGAQVRPKHLRFLLSAARERRRYKVNIPLFINL
jgi:hypothetical protein